MGRETCLNCFRATQMCFCHTLTRFEIEPLIVLLAHPKEFMRTVGTVRIVKLSLTNSILWRGRGPDFDADPKMIKIMNDENLYPMILYPGADSLNLTIESEASLQSRLPKGKRLVIFVMDGTWTTAKQIIRESRLLSTLPKVSFNVHTPSQYGFRKQPKEFCLSTVEAVSVLIENLKQKNLCHPHPESAHLEMLKPFQSLVESQVKYDSRVSRSFPR